MRESLTSYIFSHYCIAGYEISSSENSFITNYFGTGNQTVSISTGTYDDIFTLLEEIQTQLQIISATYDVSIDEDGYIVISATSNFTLADNSETLLSLLGYTQTSYSGSNSYTAETYCNLHYIPDTPEDISSTIWKYRRTGYNAVADSQAYIFRVSTTEHSYKTAVYRNISSDNCDWFFNFWSYIQHSLGIRLYEEYTDVTPVFCLLSEDSLIDPDVAYVDALNNRRMITLELVQATEPSYDNT